MESVEKAQELSKIMKKIGELAGIETICVITNMNQPIGKKIRKFFRNRRSNRSFKWEYARGCKGDSS